MVTFAAQQGGFPALRDTSVDFEYIYRYGFLDLDTLLWAPGAILPAFVHERIEEGRREVLEDPQLGAEAQYAGASSKLDCVAEPQLLRALYTDKKDYPYAVGCPGVLRMTDAQRRGRLHHHHQQQHQ